VSICILHGLHDAAAHFTGELLRPAECVSRRGAGRVMRVRRVYEHIGSRDARGALDLSESSIDDRSRHPKDVARDNCDLRGPWLLDDDGCGPKLPFLFLGKARLEVAGEWHVVRCVEILCCSSNPDIARCFFRGSVATIAGAQKGNGVRELLWVQRGFEPVRHERCTGALERGDFAPEDCPRGAVRQFKGDAVCCFGGDEAKDVAAFGEPALVGVVAGLYISIRVEDVHEQFFGWMPGDGDEVRSDLIPRIAVAMADAQSWLKTSRPFAGFPESFRAG
jgi:hypothetical protein